jgi:HK97 family phage prohead protease
MSAVGSMPLDRDCPQGTERRGIVRKIEVRKSDLGRCLEGYAAVFFDAANPEGTQFKLWSNTFERIMPGAFDNALRRPDDVRCLFNHDDCEIYGRTAAGTLTLSVDKIGLRFSCLLPDTDEATGLITSIERGDISGCSFGFRADAVTWRDVNDQTYRELTDVALYDVGPCTFPAYSGTSTEIAQRSLTAHREACTRTGTKAIDAVRRRLRLSRLGD